MQVAENTRHVSMSILSILHLLIWFWFTSALDRFLQGGFSTLRLPRHSSWPGRIHTYLYDAHQEDTHTDMSCILNNLHPTRLGRSAQMQNRESVSYHVCDRGETKDI